MTWHPDMPDEFKNQVVMGDCRELAKRIPDESVDLIFTDPPYKQEFLYLYEWLAEFAERALHPTGFLMTYCGNYWKPTVLDYLREKLEFFFDYIEINNGNSTILWPRRTIVRYKSILCFKQKEQKSLPQTNVLGVWESNGSDKRFHKWGQSEHTARYYIDCFSPENAVVCDPFVGGGTTAAVCKKLDKRFITFEIEAEYADIAKARIGQINWPAPRPQQLELQ